MNIVLVDDEQLALDFLQFQLKKVVDSASFHTFSHLDVDENKSLLVEADIIFLDVEMPKKNGLELAEDILEVNPDAHIVFVTGFNEYAIQAFELNALDYIIKPAQEERLRKTVARLSNEKRASVSDSEKLHIQVCGELAFQIEGKGIQSLKWRTLKSKEIFLYLLHFRDKTIRKAELVEICWPDSPLDKAYAQLYTAIYHIRNVLKAFNHHLKIQNVGDGYKLILEDVSIDIVEWEKAVRNAPPLHIETIQIYEDLMAMYTGSYLKHDNFYWAESERFRLEKIWTEIAMRIAKCYAENYLYEEAVKWYDKICHVSPHDEDASFALMKLYASLDYGLLVNHHYNQLENALKEIDIEMNEEIDNWYQKWRTK